MQKFFSNSPFDHDVEKATSEMNTCEDWETILQICDNVKDKPNGPKDCLRSIVKRLNSNVPHHAMSTLTLLDACVKNCDRRFLLEVSSRDFEVEIKRLLTKGHAKVVDKLKLLLNKWSQDIFKNDPELSLIPSLLNSMKNDKVEFSSSETVQTSKPAKTSRTKDSLSTQQEEDDLAKAIELSLKESSASQSSTLYPSFVSSSTTSQKQAKEPRKVRALYDFQAAEDNELSFKAGEIVLLTDDSDTNWWKGTNQTGEGLFPANFVTADLTTEPEAPIKSEKKTVKFCDEVRVKTVEKLEVEINENKINKMLHLLHEADPTGQQAECDELISLEDHCLAMGPLIDQELESIDRRHACLTASNQQLVGALNLYQTLMKDFSPTPYTSYAAPDVLRYPPSMYGAPFPANYMPPEPYQSVTALSTAEHYQGPIPPSGAVPTTVHPRVIHSAGHPHISYNNENSYASIPQTSMPISSGNFTVPVPSRDQNGMYYGDVVIASMPHPSSVPLPLQQQQPMS